MAAILERTVADDVRDALTALDDMERYARDVRAHLTAALRQTDPEGTLAQAARVAATVKASANRVQHSIRSASFYAD